MTVTLPRRRFSVAEYHSMAEAGILSEDERVELIEGEIVEMTPIGGGHAGCVNFLGRELTRSVGDQAIVSIQNPVRLSDFSEPEPDIALLRFRADFYRHTLPGAADVLLLVEVADASLDYDRRTKVPLYARSGFPEVWIVNLVQSRVDVYRNPVGGLYGEVRSFQRGESLSPLAFPDLGLTVDAILG